MATGQKRGSLVIIGRGKDRNGDCVVLREFVRASGGTKAKIPVMTAETGFPKDGNCDGS